MGGNEAIVGLERARQPPRGYGVHVKAEDALNGSAVEGGGKLQGGDRPLAAAICR